MHEQSVRKNILVLTSTFPRWKDDVEPPFVFELCWRLTDSFNVHVLAPHAPGSVNEEIINGVQVTRFCYWIPRWENLAYHGGILANLKQNPWRYTLIPFFIAAELIAIIRLIRRHQFDCIHAHWLIPHGMVAVLAFLLLKQAPALVTTSHGGDLYGLKGKVFTWIKKQIVQRSSTVTVVSRTMLDKLVGVGIDQKKIRVIPMGVDLQKRFVPPDKYRIGGSLLFVGRLVEKKGLKYLLEAFPMVLEKHPSATLRIVGEGQERERLQEYTVGLGLQDRVEFLGAMNHEKLPKLYQSAEVVVFPSIIGADGDREGFGLVLAEALGCECAAVLSDLPAMQDIVQNGRTALVVQQRNRRQLADAINCLLYDPQLRKSLGKAGRNYVTCHFDWEIIARRYTDLIETVSI